ncbi:MAG TPA: flavin reductase family protein [Nannocystis sp.]
MTDLVAPRPIAWVSTVSESGRGNLAPFSYYQAACSRPPMIVLSVAWWPDGRMKDTLANALQTRELTVNHVSTPLAPAMNATSAPFPPETSEWEACGIAPEPAAVVRPPRVAGALACLECRLVHALPLGAGAPGRPSSTLLVAEVVHFAVAEALVRRDARGRLTGIDPAALDAVGRLGGIAYTRTTDRFELARPDAPTPPRADGDRARD